MTKAVSIVSSYHILRKCVEQTLLLGRRKVEQAKIQTYWETGRIINKYILEYERATRGQETIKRLAVDLKISETVLHRCVKFYDTYPSLRKVAPGPLFSWTHYRQLITVPDDKKRSDLEKAITQKGLSSKELAVRIQEETPPPQEPKASCDNRPLTPLRGQLYTYKLVERPNLSSDVEAGLLVDLGFGIFHEVDRGTLSGFGKDQIVELEPKEDAYKFIPANSPASLIDLLSTNKNVKFPLVAADETWKFTVKKEKVNKKTREGVCETGRDFAWRLNKSDRTEKDRYTYSAFVEKVIDGDTVKVRLDLGFNVWTRQTLRLRGIDCAEVGTSEGDEAKTFVRAHLKESQQIIVRSSRSDKYDRYLADVFIPQGEEPNPETDIYLNNLLLESGRAGRM